MGVKGGALGPPNFWLVYQLCCNYTTANTINHGVLLDNILCIVHSMHLIVGFIDHTGLLLEPCNRDE